MVFIIAEAGVNHNGDVNLARDLIDAAADAGADAVKFQTFDAEKLDPPGPRRDALKKLELSQQAHEWLKEHAEKHGIEFISTPFDVDSLRFLVEDLGVKTLKIASGNLDNWPLLRAAAGTPCGLIVSTGMAGVGEIDGAFACIGREVCFLHCVSTYPAPANEMNLSSMPLLKTYPGCEVGLSDHTLSKVVPAGAAAMGASVIEKHLTLDRRMEGPDHLASLEPQEFAEMVRNIREVEKALGDGIKAPRESEYPAMQIAMERKAWREKQCAS